MGVLCQLISVLYFLLMENLKKKKSPAKPHLTKGRLF